MILAAINAPTTNYYSLGFPTWFLVVVTVCFLSHLYMQIKHYQRIKKRLQRQEEARQK